jgi:hypothetical protein
MSGPIENEMTNCLQQMAELQAKMEVLQEEKNNKAAEEVVKKQEVEPNLKVMSEWLKNASLNKNVHTFQRTAYLNPNHRRGTNGHPTTVPTYFMKQYIESTHNMFLIQQKRINELEERLEKLKPELSNEDFGFDAEDSRRAYVQPRSQDVERAREDESTRKINLALDN